MATTTAEDASEPSSSETIKGKCDLCSKPDGYGGHNLQKCKECGLLIHELCYATIPTESKNPDYLCHACKASGTEIEVNVPSKVGGCGPETGQHRETMKQDGRPVECALCSVKTGNHAMHPLFDMPGPEGRQLVLPASGAGFKRTEKRLAWVHSLCAQFINSTWGVTRGCVYGLYDGGRYEMDGGDDKSDHGQIYEVGTQVQKIFDAGAFRGEIVAYHEKEKLYTVKYEDGDEEDLEEDEVEEILVSRKKSRRSSDSAKADDEKSEDDEGLVATEAFCINTDPGNAKIIKDSRELKCTICNSNDKHSLRIPVQCNAGDKKEFREFKRCHKMNKRGKDIACRLAVHVGCARWASKKYAAVQGKSLRMCYYYPGQKAGFEGEERYQDPVCDAFCRVHAREIMENLHSVVKNMNDGEASSEEEPENPETKAANAIAEKKKKNKFLEDSDEDE